MTDEDIESLVKACERLGTEIDTCINLLSSRAEIDKRCLAIAKTNLQTGVMWLKRSILQPDGF